MADQGPNCPVAADAVRQAQRLLCGAGASADKRWSRLRDEDLGQTVEEYRACIRNLTQRLAALGDNVSLEQADDADKSGSGAGLTHLGEEGVDYTLGSADDLDPSEWQVNYWPNEMLVADIPVKGTDIQ